MVGVGIFGLVGAESSPSGTPSPSQSGLKTHPDISSSSIIPSLSRSPSQIEINLVTVSIERYEVSVVEAVSMLISITPVS